MNWLQKKGGYQRITTTPTRMTKKELDVAVQDLLDRGWEVIDSGTMNVEETSSLSSSHRSSGRGMSKSRTETVITETKQRFWCKMRSPERNPYQQATG